MAHHVTSGSDRAEWRAALAAFQPPVQEWFGEHFGRPTEVQALAWPRIAAGEHVLVTAPTGSGKTLTAFLWSLDQLLGGAWEGGRVRVLYVSPLRALNNDIQRNLLTPLADLQRRFGDGGAAVQSVRVLTRSGDTPDVDRRRMIRNPPEILITTPESLNILLTSKGGRSMLGSLRCVILDEIHAVAGSKRGTHLITAIERLTLLSGEFQRIALSATARPTAQIARFVGGYRLLSASADEREVYEPRRVAVVDARMHKRYGLSVESRLPSREEAAAAEDTSVWQPLIADLAARIRANRSTLLFANSRRVTEKLTRLLNESEGRDLAYSHHGSLSREIRSLVEERLKQGRLAAIVATSSLELGIDIGALDEVVLIQTPASVAASVQRLGRAGHAVGQISRGRFYPLYPRDLLEAVVMAAAVAEHDIEKIQPLVAPLDVLAQILVSMVAAEPWGIDDLYRFVRTAAPYRQLSRRQFDLVLEMLAGRYADSRVRELEPRLSIDRVDRRLRARRGADRLIYSSGGTIPDRGYFHLRLQEGMAKLGELDEEFVWERSVGDTFTLGAQSWQIAAITHNDVLVRPARRSSAMAPFWRAEERDRSFHFSERLGRFLAAAERLLARPNGGEKLRRWLRDQVEGEEALADLVRLLEEQRAVTGRALPHRHHLLIERLPGEGGADDRRQVIVHTLWGGTVNRPLALALAALWERERGEPLAVEQDNDCLMLLLPERIDPTRLLRQLGPENVQRLLRSRLEQSGFFGARFRENAGRALLLPRGSFRRRVPLWFNRQRAKQMLAAVQRYEDFPILVETWRTCLQDEFDLASLAKVLSELESGEILCSEISMTSPSPLAADIVWKRTRRLMYEDDRPETDRRSGLRPDLLRELVQAGRLRPRLPSALIDRFERKLQRTHPGYAPRTAEEVIDWVQERVALPLRQWNELLAAVRRDGQLGDLEMEALLSVAETRLLRLGNRPGAEPLMVAHVESVPRLARCFGESIASLPVAPLRAEGSRRAPEPAASPVAPDFDSGEGIDREIDPPVELIAEWIRFCGPFRRALLSDALGLDRSRVDEALEALAADERVVIDHFRRGAGEEDELEICDAENLERLLRLLRAESRPRFEARPLAELPLFLAHQQGVVAGTGGSEGLMAALERLFGYPASVALWESEVLPARLDPYYTSWLDGLFHDTELVWTGTGKQQIAFCLRADQSLFQERSGDDAVAAAVEADEALPGEPGRYAFDELLDRTGWGPARLGRHLWERAWRGQLTNTTFEAVRRAARNRFRFVEGGGQDAESRRRRRYGRGARRHRFGRWRSDRAMSGYWYRSTPGVDDGPMDALEAEELNKDRARLLVQRYGVVFRELCARELPLLQWSRLFRALRLMELSGELLSGYFFTGVSGPQFASPEALDRLREGLPEDVVFWLNAADPASACGLGLEPLRRQLPARRPSTHLVYQGSRLVVVSRRHGRVLKIKVPTDHPRLADYLRFLGVLLTRQFAPRRAIIVETINGEPAADSAYRRPLAEWFQCSREPGVLKLRRRY